MTIYVLFVRRLSSMIFIIFYFPFKYDTLTNAFPKRIKKIKPKRIKSMKYTIALNCLWILVYINYIKSIFADKFLFYYFCGITKLTSKDKKTLKKSMKMKTNIFHIELILCLRIFFSLYSQFYNARFNSKCFICLLNELK